MGAKRKRIINALKFKRQVSVILRQEPKKRVLKKSVLVKFNLILVMILGC